jgi:cytoskeletal protein CcmA (bactofilin family)
VAPREKREAPTSISAEAPTVIGKDTVIKGELKSTTDMLIQGRVEGHIQGANHVIIGESGDVAARVEAQVITVRGTVHGDCEGTKKVEITETGKVFGNIASRAIKVAEGATFKGVSKMVGSGEQKLESPEPKLREKAAPEAPVETAPAGVGTTRPPGAGC